LKLYKAIVIRYIYKKHLHHSIKLLQNAFPPRSHSAPKSLTATLIQEIITKQGKFLESVPTSRA